MFCSPIPKSESSPHHLMSACPYHCMTPLTSLSTLQQSYQDANSLVCPGLFFSSAIAENARLEPPRLRQESSTAMFFTPTDSFQRARHSNRVSLPTYRGLEFDIASSRVMLALRRHISHDLHGQQFHRP